MTDISTELEQLFYAGHEWQCKGEYDKALECYDRAIAIEPEFYDAYRNRGGEWFRRGEYEKGMSDLTKAISLRPEIGDAYFIRAHFNQEINPDMALKDFSEYVRICPDEAQGHYFVGALLREKGEFDLSIESHSKAIALSLGSSDESYYEKALWDRSVAKSEKGDLKGAVEDLNHLIHVKPEKSLYWFTRGNYRDDMGQVDEAISDLTEAIRLQGETDDRENLHTIRGICLVKKGLQEEALDDFFTVFKLNPTPKVMHILQALCHGKIASLQAVLK